MAADRTIAALGRALRNRALTSAQITEQCLERIAALNGTLNAFITVTAETARRQAREADRELKTGHDYGPLHGIPISLKDLIDVEGTPTTAASRVREGHVAKADSVVASRLRAAGAVFVGKTNLHEFALGTTNEDSAYGPARHPLDPSRSPGGSSGGSAIAVATGMSIASIGSDTGGSIRIPAAACGVVGLKPTIGEIPIEGVVPLSGTLDHLGALTGSVGDARIVFAAMRGTPVPASDAPAPRELRLGIPRNYFLQLMDPQVTTAFEAACTRLAAAGVRIDEVVLPHASDLAAIYTHIVLSEAAAYHAPTLERAADAYSPNVRLRLEMGRYILAEDYVRALKGRQYLRREVDAALDGRDALLLPALAVPATKLGAETVRVATSDEPVRSITLRLTQLFNVTGHPAIAIPCGFTPGGLPVGAQLAARHDHTTRLLDIAQALEPYLGPEGSR